MMSEEDEVSLVVEGNHTSSLELRVVGKQRSKHPTHGVTQPGGEVVQYHFGKVGGGSPVTLTSMTNKQLGISHFVESDLCLVHH